MRKKQHLFSITKKDLDIQTFRSGGKGGQHQNKTDSGVRIIHKESGARGECRNHREQIKNKREAFKRLTENIKFKIWINRKSREVIDKKTIEERVEEMIKNDKIKIEFKENGKWMEYGTGTSKF